MKSFLLLLGSRDPTEASAADMSLADRRRNLGPTDTVPLAVEGVKREPELSDGLRPVFIAQGVASHANGSAYLEVGECRFQCSVYGPQPSRKDFNPRAEVNVNIEIENFAGIEDHENTERTISDFVKTCVTPAIVLDDYPKSEITITVTVLAAGPSLYTQLAAAVNVATLGLINAGIALHDMVTAVSVAVHENVVYTDVDLFDDATRLVGAYLMAQDKLVGVSVGSKTDVKKIELENMLEKSRQAAIELRKVFNGFLVEDYAQRK